MSISKSERQQIENEMIFRRINEKVANSLDELDAMHAKDGDHDLVRDEDMRLMFLCECSDENCTVRIPLSVDDYQDIHENRKTFIVEAGHEVDPIEKVVQKEKHYNVVLKNNITPEPGSFLNDTTIDNS